VQPCRLPIGPADGADGNAQAPGKVAMGGQAGAGREMPRGDVLANDLGDGAVFGSGASGDIWLVNCHGVNIVIDFVKGVNNISSISSIVDTFLKMGAI